MLIHRWTARRRRGTKSSFLGWTSNTYLSRIGARSGQSRRCARRRQPAGKESRRADASAGPIPLSFGSLLRLPTALALAVIARPEHDEETPDHFPFGRLDPQELNALSCAGLSRPRSPALSVLVRLTHT